MTAHSRFGGSVIGRILACPGSVALCDTVPKAPSSPYADEGSAAHKLAELCLKGDCHPMDFLDERMEDYVNHPVTMDMIGAVLTYLEAVTHELALTKDAELYVEQGFKLDIDSAEDGEVFGTNDAMVYHPSTGRLRVFDYKHGVGVSVSAEDNAQLKFYAAGAVFSSSWTKLTEVILTIVQPRARDVDENGAVRDWTFEVPDLFEFLAEVDQAVREAKRTSQNDPLGSAKLKTGSHCRWCDAAAVCPAKEAEVLAATGLAFQDITLVDADVLPEPSTMTFERVGAVLAAGKLLNDWLNQIMEFVEAQSLAGHHIPGWKVVEKIGRAKWISDEETVAATLSMLYDLDENLIRPRKLTTIGDVEKLMKAAGATKDQIDSFKMQNTLKESSGLTLAPDSDRRPAIDVAQRAFGDVQT